MPRLTSIIRSLLIVATAAIAFSSAQAALCSPSGRYFRAHGDQIQIAALSGESDGPPRANFDLIILGRMVRDAPTVGTAEGEILLTGDYCIGVYSAPGACVLVFSFTAKQVRVRQIDHCNFGAGAYADGIYVKTTKAPRYLQ